MLAAATVIFQNEVKRGSIATLPSTVQNVAVHPSMTPLAASLMTFDARLPYSNTIEADSNYFSSACSSDKFLAITHAQRHHLRNMFL